MGGGCNCINKCLHAAGIVSWPGDLCVILEGSKKMHTKVPISLKQGMERHVLSQTTVIILQESFKNICNSLDHPAGYDLNDRHTFVGLDGVPLMFCLWKSSRPLPQCHLHRTLSGYFSLHLDGMLLGTLQVIPAQPPAGDTPGQL